MTEAELQAAVIELANLYGWSVAHFRPGMSSKGRWMTAVAGQGKGFPDLVMVSDKGLAFVELKSKSGRLTPEQAGWLEALEPHVDAMVWRPTDWQDGTIERYLLDPG